MYKIFIHKQKVVLIIYLIFYQYIVLLILTGANHLFYFLKLYSYDYKITSWAN